MSDEPETRHWQYVLVTDTDDAAERARRVESGQGSISLERTVPDWSVEQVLLPDGQWQPANRLDEIRYRGALYWVTPIDIGEAQDIVARWVRIGRLATTDPLQECLPPRLAADLADREDVDARAETLRTDAALDGATRKRALSTLLDGPSDLADGWVRAEPGYLAVPAFSAWFTDAADADRQAAALRRFSDTVLVLLVDPDVRAELKLLPEGVSMPADAQWLRAAAGLYLTMLPRLLTTPGLECAVLNGDDYDVVGGPRSFVEAVLGRSVEQAWAEFLEFARGDGFVPPNRDLSDVVARYRPYAEEST